MQYLRLIPAKLGLIDTAAFILQIKRINPDDIFVVSYPKSGSTWVSFIIAYMKTGRTDTITFKEMEQIVPFVYNSQDLIDSQQSHRIIKTHRMFFDHYPRTIYIYRDYRDVLVSFYHYQVGLKYFSGSFSEFIRVRPLFNHEGSWTEHLSKAIQFKEAYPEKMLMISYESLLTDFKVNALEIARFCKFEIDDKRLDQIMEKTSFRNLKENETKHGSHFMDTTKEHFIREGRIGGWKDTFTKKDLDYLYSDHLLVSIMERLGYYPDTKSIVR